MERGCLWRRDRASLQFLRALSVEAPLLTKRGISGLIQIILQIYNQLKSMLAICQVQLPECRTQLKILGVLRIIVDILESISFEASVCPINFSDIIPM